MFTGNGFVGPQFVMQFPCPPYWIGGKLGSVGSVGAQHAPGTVKPSGPHCACAPVETTHALTAMAAARKSRWWDMGSLWFGEVSLNPPSKRRGEPCANRDPRGIRLESVRSARERPPSSRSPSTPQYGATHTPRGFQRGGLHPKLGRRASALIGFETA